MKQSAACVKRERERVRCGLSMSYFGVAGSLSAPRLPQQTRETTRSRAAGAGGLFFLRRHECIEQLGCLRRASNIAQEKFRGCGVCRDRRVSRSESEPSMANGSGFEANPEWGGTWT